MGPPLRRARRAPGVRLRLGHQVVRAAARSFSTAARSTRETCIWLRPTIVPISAWVRSCSKRSRTISRSRAVRTLESAGSVARRAGGECWGGRGRGAAVLGGGEAVVIVPQARAEVELVVLVAADGRRQRGR